MDRAKKPENGKERITAKVGTRTQHFIDFIEIVMDILDKNNMKRKTLVMYNARIHHSKAVKELIGSKGIKALYLPPSYSSFLTLSSYFGQN